MAEVEPKAPQKTRRRWRVITAVGLAAIVVWWAHPREDSRFVGAWTMSTSDRLGQPQLEEWTFRSSGKGWIDEATSTPRKFAWRVQGDELLLDTDWPTGWEGFRLALLESWNRLAGRQSSRRPHRLKILLALRDEIMMTWFDAGVSEGQVMLKRR